MPQFGASWHYTASLSRLLTFKDPFSAVTDALNLYVALLNHIFHHLLCLLQIIW